ncbi:MAG: hypothetical protein IJU70_00175 [Lentisphaeria bacterium]|nr:hypothetical protein [Lentisphaeria bacterium]
MNLQCPYCSGNLEADDSVIGGRARCPLCGRKFLVDRTGAGLKMDELSVICPGCSGRIVLERRNIRGKKACPCCGRHFIVAAPGKAPPPDSTPAAAPISAVRNNIVNACILAGVICFIIVCAALCVYLLH